MAEIQIPPITDTASVTGGGSGVASQKRKQKNKGSTIIMSHGRRTMKAYPISEGELWQLFTIGLVAAISLSIASGSFTFGLEIYKDLDFNPGLSESIITSWKQKQLWCFGLCIGFIVIAVFAIIIGRFKIQNIIAETQFDED